MARKKAVEQSMSEQFLDWFEDQADPIEQEYVLNYLARLQRRGNGKPIPVTPTTSSALTTRKPRATGAEARTERQAKVSQPQSAVAVASGPRRTGFGGTPTSPVTRTNVKASDEGDGKVDTE